MVNYRVKKFFILLFVTTIAISTATGNLFNNESMGNVAYAANQLMNVEELDNNYITVPKENDERFKTQFAYEMAQITAKVISIPVTNVEKVKIELVYATAQVTAKVMPIIPSARRKDFAYEMAEVTTKIVSAPNFDIGKAKAEFTYQIAQITAKIIINADKFTNGIEGQATSSTNNAEVQATLLRNNADIEQKALAKVNNTETASKTIVYTGDITPATYTGLVDELLHVGEHRQSDDKVKMDAEIRFHYAFNKGLGPWAEDSSGIRTYLGFESVIDKDWHAYSVLEYQKSLLNYDNEFKFSNLFVERKVDQSVLKVGAFGYLMADGNIYDSDFKGVRADFGKVLRYTLSAGETDYTKKTYIATVQYNDFDYNLETSIYHYQMEDATYGQNTIRTFSGKYNFSNFGVGAMFLNASRKDSSGEGNGYVFSLNYGDLKTYREGTYGLFAKYYDQARGTYIAHGMNGAGSVMEGFKGYGLGINYTLAKNVVAGIEYYNLTDKISGRKGDTLWNQVTHYF